jgi:aldehyde dehydrogenase (NAD+)
MAISVAVAVGDRVADALVEKLAPRVRALAIGPGDAQDRDMGPLITSAHRDKVKAYVDAGVAEGATLVVDGRGLEVAGSENGFFLGGCLFDRVRPQMRIYREEIFGPVLCMLGYDDLDHAVALANDTDYGLAGYVSGADLDTARAVARKIRAGWVTINHAFDLNAPFGGYKRSGNGREWSSFGFHEYLEVKSILGYAPDKSAQ